ncbi:hypothetical protein D3H65_03670 [Paraflavitalea soli]|uniref:Uncharacterized protein n=1 Tax=Paraflavitalea soli TaxID=2315862 RepID=A0A3B7MIJ2_9BACT|nr:hypothetical protein [Paraflavitalea soli]AXY73123.1 hypothetical protein D3H65_03670 [Paraflavitalea soli]
MNQVFPLNNEKSWQSLLVTDEKLFVINRSYDNPNDFMKGFNDEGLGRLLKSKKEIDVQYITGLQHAEKEPVELKIVHEKKIMLKFRNPADLAEVATWLAGKRLLKMNTQQLTPLKAIQRQLIGLALIALFGWVLYTEAKTIEEGGTIDFSGRRAGMKRLMAWVAEQLGTQGVLIVAGLAIAACGYFIYKNIKTPPNQVVYA